MRAPAAIAALLVLAPPAAADTVARRAPAVGPALAGDAVAWGEEPRRGGARVLLAAPGAPPRVVHDVPPPTGAKTRRGFMHIPAAFAASADAFAALVVTNTVVEEEFDSISSVSELAALGGPLPGPGALLSGSIPERAGFCTDGPVGGPGAVDVDGPRIAVAEYETVCHADALPRHRIAIHGPSGRVDVPAPGRDFVRHVELAGRFVAWIQDHGLVVHDLERGTVVARVRPRDVGALLIEDAALQGDGTVAFTFVRRTRSREVALAVLPATGRIRTLDRRVASRGVAIAAGRVLYERDAGRDGAALVLRDVASRRARVLTRISPRRIRIGGLDLDARSATWAVVRRNRSGLHEPARGARGHIVLRAL